MLFVGILGTITLLHVCSQEHSSSQLRRLTEANTTSEYPDDLLLDKPYRDSDKKYLLFIHAFGIIYMFAGLAIVCDDYFVTSLESMVERYGISEDVAGATFMAAGGSAPELFTSFMAIPTCSPEPPFLRSARQPSSLTC